MRAAKMTERPSFQLMVQTDVQSIYHMQMPRWLFFRSPLLRDEPGRQGDLHLPFEPLPALTQERMGQRARRSLCDLPRKALPRSCGSASSV